MSAVRGVGRLSAATYGHRAILTICSVLPRHHSPTPPILSEPPGRSMATTQLA